MSTAPHTVNVSATSCRLAGEFDRLVILKNTGAIPVRVVKRVLIDRRPAFETVDTVAPGATVEYSYPAESLSLVSAAPTTVSVTRFDHARDLIARETGVPAELLIAGRDEAELRASAARIAAWKTA